MLKGSDGRIGEARVDVTELVSGKTLRRLGSRGKYVARGGKDGFTVFTLGGAYLAGPHCECVKFIIVFEIWHVPSLE